MGIWREVFGWKTLLRFDVWGALVPSIFIACGFALMATDWFPHNLLIAQILFAFAMLLILAKIVAHAHESAAPWLSKITFATVLSIVTVAVFSILLWVIQKHKGLSLPARTIPASLVWNTPSPIDANTPLSSRELNATSSVEGTFVYNPTFGTTLVPGTDTLSVTFTPTENAYSPVSKTVTITVNSPPRPDPPKGRPQEDPKVTLVRTDSSTIFKVGEKVSMQWFLHTTVDPLNVKVSTFNAVASIFPGNMETQREMEQVIKQREENNDHIFPFTLTNAQGSSLASWTKPLTEQDYSALSGGKFAVYFVSKVSDDHGNLLFYSCVYKEISNPLGVRACMR